MMRIGVVVELFRKPFYECIDLASELGVSGIQIMYTHKDEGIDLMNCTQAEADALLQYCGSRNLEISAVCGDMGAHFAVASAHEEILENYRRIIDGTRRLGVKVVTTHIGCIPEWDEDPSFKSLVDCIRPIAQYAASKGAVLAIETGPELASVLKGFIEAVGSEGLGVNLDCGNLRGVCGEDPAYAAEILAPYIVHTHAKDMLHLNPGSAARVYGILNPDGTKRNLLSRPAGYKEVSLGEGQVNWQEYLTALKKNGYDGFLTIEREVGEDPVGDITKSVKFLREQLRKLEA